MRRSRKLVGLLTWSALACGFDPVEIQGKACSTTDRCPSGYQCIDGACARTSAASGGGGTAGGSGGAPSCTPAFTVSDFHRLWAAPTMVCWKWTPLGTAQDFIEYKVIMGTTPAELDAARARALDLDPTNDGPGSGPGRVWTKADNPELGLYEIAKSSGPDLVTSTRTDELIPNTSYLAELAAFDTKGCAFVTNTVPAVTPVTPTVGTYVAFDEAIFPAGYQRPSAAVIVSDEQRAYSGSNYISYTSPAPMWENVGVSGLSATTEHFPTLAGEFQSALLEISVAVDGGSAPGWVEFQLPMYPSDCNAPVTEEVKWYNWTTLRNTGSYQLIQVPLGAFSRGEKAMTAADMTLLLCGIWVGATWTTGQEVRVDAVRLVW